MRIALKQTRLGLRPSSTRIPFRYGKACMTECPQAVYEVVIETEEGRRVQHGYSGDCLPPAWFDKAPEKSYDQQLREMVSIIECGSAAWSDALRTPRTFFEAWLDANATVHEHAQKNNLPRLLASLGLSFGERAVMDAMARAAGMPLFQALTTNLFHVNLGEVDGRLAGSEPADWLPRTPRETVWVRHTVGLGDPLTDSELDEENAPADGRPVSLEAYLRETGLRYLKIKVGNQLEHDLDRLERIAQLMASYRGEDYAVTLDGNELYTAADAFDELVEAMGSRDSLRSLWDNTLLIEQPLARSIALDEGHTGGIRQLSQRKPVIIDESDGCLEDFPSAVELGYRGVSSKNCKGPIKSLVNMARIRKLNAEGGAEARGPYVMTGEDLCTVGIIPVQSDLCLVAALGLEHVERNGHHFHPGLDYLPQAEQQAALENHGDLYDRFPGGRVAPRVRDGRFHLSSLQCPGYGFRPLPDMSQRTPATALGDRADPSNS